MVFLAYHQLPLLFLVWRSYFFDNLCHFETFFQPLLLNHTKVHLVVHSATYVWRLSDIFEVHSGLIFGNLLGRKSCFYYHQISISLKLVPMMLEFTNITIFRGICPRPILCPELAKSWYHSSMKILYFPSFLPFYLNQLMFRSFIPSSPFMAATLLKSIPKSPSVSISLTGYLPKKIRNAVANIFPVINSDNIFTL